MVLGMLVERVRGEKGDVLEFEGAELLVNYLPDDLVGGHGGGEVD